MNRTTRGGSLSVWRRRPGGLVLSMLSVALLSACGDSPEQMISSAKTYLSKNDPGAATIQLKNALQ